MWLQPFRYSIVLDESFGFLRFVAEFEFFSSSFFVSDLEIEHFMNEKPPFGHNEGDDDSLRTLVAMTA